VRAFAELFSLWRNLSRDMQADPRVRKKHSLLND
jgi:hypothetical protein